MSGFHKLFMKKGMILLVLLVLVFVANAGARITITGDVVSEGDLDVSSILLKVSVTQGDFVEKLINVGSDFGGEINLEVIGAEGVSLEESNFVIGLGESRDVKVIFDSASLDPGVYVGSIRIASSREIRSLPVILEPPWTS